MFFLNLTWYFVIMLCYNEIMSVQNSFPSKPNEDLFIVCHTEFGLPQADKVVLHPMPTFLHYSDTYYHKLLPKFLDTMNRRVEDAITIIVICSNSTSCNWLGDFQVGQSGIITKEYNKQQYPSINETGGKHNKDIYYICDQTAKRDLIYVHFRGTLFITICWLHQWTNSTCV